MNVDTNLLSAIDVKLVGILEKMQKEHFKKYPRLHRIDYSDLTAMVEAELIILNANGFEEVPTVDSLFKQLYVQFVDRKLISTEENPENRFDIMEVSNADDSSDAFEAYDEDEDEELWDDEEDYDDDEND